MVLPLNGMAVNETNLTSLPGAEGIVAFILSLLAVVLLVLIGLYVWRSLAWMSLSKQLKRGTPWYAWIPILNMVLVWQMSGMSVQTLYLFFASLAVQLISFILFIIGMLGVYSLTIISIILLVLTGIVMIIITVIWWLHISEARGYPGWAYLLVYLTRFIPYVSTVSILLELGYYSMLAWAPRSTAGNTRLKPPSPSRTRDAKRKNA